MPLSGEDGGDELRVGMAPPSKVADNSVNVKRRAVAGDDEAIAIVFKEKPAGRAGCPGHPGTAGIEGTDAVNEPVRGQMSMAADHDISAASRQQRAELLIGDVRCDSWAVVGAG